MYRLDLLHGKIVEKTSNFDVYSERTSGDYETTESLITNTIVDRDLVKPQDPYVQGTLYVI